MFQGCDGSCVRMFSKMSTSQYSKFLNSKFRNRTQRSVITSNIDSSDEWRNYNLLTNRISTVGRCGRGRTSYNHSNSIDKTCRVRINFAFIAQISIKLATIWDIMARHLSFHIFKLPKYLCQCNLKSEIFFNIVGIAGQIQHRFCTISK